MKVKEKLHGADGIRALACMMVMLCHAFLRADSSQSLIFKKLQELMFHGSSGVSIFFVLSGFLLSYPFWKAYSEKAQLPNLKEYFLKRAARIVPAFYLNITIVFIVSLFVFPISQELILRYITGITFTNSFSYRTFFPAELNGPLWSIGFEVFSYSLLPIFMSILFSVKTKRSINFALFFWFIILILFTVLNKLMLIIFSQINYTNEDWQLSLVRDAKNYWWPNYNPIGLFCHYIFGILASGLLLKFNSCEQLIPRKLLFEILSIILVILIGFVIVNGTGFQFQNQPYNFPIFALLIGLLLSVLPLTQIMEKIFDNIVFRFISTISFGLYIWHYFFLWLIYYLIPDSISENIVSNWLIKVIIAYTISFLVATISWYFFEKPILIKTNKLTYLLIEKPSKEAVTQLHITVNTALIGQILICFLLIIVFSCLGLSIFYLVKSLN